MKIHEYQAKELLRQFGVPVPKGIPAFTVQEAVEAAQKLGGPVWVVKAQIHAGGRGKAGGVKVARDLEAVQAAAAAMLGQRLVTRQTGAAGLPIDRVYVEAGSDIERELYLSLTLNREKGRIAGEQSSRNWGWIRQQGRDFAELPIMMESLSLWQQLSTQIGKSPVPNGFST